MCVLSTCRISLVCHPERSRGISVRVTRNGWHAPFPLQDVAGIVLSVRNHPQVIEWPMGFKDNPRTPRLLVSIRALGAGLRGDRSRSSLIVRSAVALQAFGSREDEARMQMSGFARTSKCTSTAGVIRPKATYSYTFARGPLGA